MRSRQGDFMSGGKVVEYKGRFALATWDDRAHQWTEPMTPEAKRKTGCLAVFSRSEAGIVSSACVRHFRTRRAAELALALRERPEPEYPRLESSKPSARDLAPRSWGRTQPEREYGSTTPGYEGDE